MAISKLAFFGQPGTYEATLFEETFEDGTLGSFTTVNDGTNDWVVGTDANTTIGSGGTYSAYISDDGSTWDYAGTSQASHIYVDIDFPASGEGFNLEFLWSGEGEDGSGASSWDYMRVSLAPTSYTPSAGTEATSTYRLDYGESTRNYGKYNEGHPEYSGSLASPEYSREVVAMTSFSEGGSLAGTSKRLIFTWKNDGSLGSQPISLNDVKITYTAKTGTDSEPSLGTLEQRIPSDNLILLLDPSKETYTDNGTTPVSSDGDLVYRIDDQSATGENALQATLTNRPAWYESGQAQRPYIEFDGVDNFLEIADNAAHSPDDMSIYFVFRNDDITPTVYDTYFAKTDSVSWNDGYGTYMNSSNDLISWFNAYNINAVNNAEHDTDPSDPKILCYRFKTSAATYENNNLLNDGTEDTGTTASSLTPSTSALLVGKSAGGSYYGTFKMYAMVMYDTYHDDATRTSVMNALNTYFGGIY